MQENIGLIAGEVWRYLNAEGPKSLAAITRSINQPDVMVHMAIGWLAREGKLDFNKTPRGVIISLK